MAKILRKNDCLDLTHVRSTADGRRGVYGSAGGRGLADVSVCPQGVGGPGVCRGDESGDSPLLCAPALRQCGARIYSGTLWKPFCTFQYMVARRFGLDRLSMPIPAAAGKPVTDICLLYYDDIEGKVSLELPAFGGGYDYDICAPKQFLKMNCTNGVCRLPNGQEYRLILLPEHPFMTYDLLRHLHEMIQSGALVSGHPPAGT